VLSETLYPVIAEDEPKLETPKAPPKTELPLPKVDHSVVTVIPSLEKVRRHAQNFSEMLAVANP
jgi:hypothetical protein